MAYVEGFALAVPHANRQTYEKMAVVAAHVYKEHGALSVIESWGDDVPDGGITSFPMAVKAKADEAVVFSWVLWPSREARDAGNAKVFADPRMKPTADAPFDSKRMIYGGFEVFVEA
ncbi:DUF1428 domain-containing protein [Methylobacterium nodulans]|uniref:RNA signal recognition particle 4.5S RNA n=1 Tax=Methylobacterium nodulans (strain LMG 21967 / CNCM I-2342 / ORS 2060) TaxID=460265 RepID=B8IGF6_METNO|nr:DUF1428 domain-containing protein [Methylobacterium nodulans]ACL55856.1 protein of unknown function DUF1428 [Methylobacterium nodulans ORS 2060]